MSAAEGRGHGASAARIAQAIGAPSPTPEQARIVEAPPRPLLVVAGAGSGKTETMAARVLWLVANGGFAPEEVLGLTFTRKAAGELASRLRDRLGRLRDAGLVPGDAGGGEPQVFTYNSFAARLVREHGLRIGVDPEAGLLGEAGAWQLMTDVVESWDGELDPSLSVLAAVEQALGLAGQLAEHGIEVEEARAALASFGAELDACAQPRATGELKHGIEANGRRLALLALVEQYDRRKRAAGVLDFSDQVRLAARIAAESPDVAAQLRAEHRAVLLDEFQDTSVVQVRLLASLFRDHPVTAVGDPNQAIYGWRGASAAALEGFHRHFSPGGAAPDQTLTLSTSWRNDRRILAVANKVAGPLRAEARRAALPELRARPGAGEGLVRAAYALDRDSQARAVADFVAEQRRAGRRSVAVLCRKRSDFAQVDQALRGRDIPTQVLGLGGLLDQPAVADVRAALTLCVDVAASDQLMRLLGNLDLGAADLACVGEWSRELARRDARGEAHPATTLLEAIDRPDQADWAPAHAPALTSAARERIRVLSRRLRALRRDHGGSVVEQVERTIRVLGVRADAVADPLANTGGEALDAFVDVAGDFQAQARGATMRGFLAWLDAAEQRERGLDLTVEPDPEAVQIMTVHGAKGLEWDAVAVFGLGDGAFPSHDGPPRERCEAPSSGWFFQARELPHPLRGDADSLPDFAPEAEKSSQFNSWFDHEYRVRLGHYAAQEERRLAYVAFTRARTALLLAGCWVDTGTRIRPPSTFLREPVEDGLVADARIAPRPDAEQVQELAHREEPSAYPRRPGRSRELATDAAGRFAAERALVEAARARGRSPWDLLAELGEDPAAQEVRALLEERRIQREGGRARVQVDRVPATSLVRLLGDPNDFALDLRRPTPREPNASASLGIAFHAWVERRLRLGADAAPGPGSLAAEAGDADAAASELDVADALAALGPQDRRRFEGWQRNFEALGVADRLEPVAVEEPFALQVGGLPVPGRIDAVFRDPTDGNFVLVDWKTGRPPQASDDPARLRAFLTQLRVYRLAWAARQGLPERRVRAELAFLAGPRLVTLEDLAAMLGEDPDATSLEDAVRAVLPSW